MTDRAREPVEPPASHDIQLAFVDSGHELVQLGAAILRTRDPVIHELPRDDPPTLLCETAKTVELEVGRLVGGADAGVQPAAKRLVSKGHVFGTFEVGPE